MAKLKTSTAEKIKFNTEIPVETGRKIRIHLLRYELSQRQALEEYFQAWASLNPDKMAEIEKFLTKKK